MSLDDQLEEARRAADQILAEAHERAREVMVKAHHEARGLIEEAGRAAQVMTIETSSNLAAHTLATMQRLEGVERVVAGLISEFVKALQALREAVPKQEGLGGLLRDTLSAFNAYAKEKPP